MVMNLRKDLDFFLYHFITVWLTIMKMWIKSKRYKEANKRVLNLAWQGFQIKYFNCNIFIQRDASRLKYCGWRPSSNLTNYFISLYISRIFFFGYIGWGFRHEYKCKNREKMMVVFEPCFDILTRSIFQWFVATALIIHTQICHFIISSSFFI